MQALLTLGVLLRFEGTSGLLGWDIIHHTQEGAALVFSSKAHKKKKKKRKAHSLETGVGNQ